LNGLGAGRIETVALRRPRSDQAHPCICDFAAGDVYRYFDFPNETYQQFLLAESKRQFFLTNIRNCLRYERLAKLQVA
jgi:KTSC domain-containing protein